MIKLFYLQFFCWSYLASLYTYASYKQERANWGKIISEEAISFLAILTTEKCEKFFDELQSEFWMGFCSHLWFKFQRSSWLQLISKSIVTTLRSLLNELACLTIVTTVKQASSFNRELRVQQFWNCILDLNPNHSCFCRNYSPPSDP